MPITRTVLAVANHHPDQPAIVAEDGQLTYAQLVHNSRHMFTVVQALHRAQPTPPISAPETHGIPITAVSLSSTFHTARIIAGLAGFRAVSATIDPQWPLEHRAGVILATGIGVVITDSADLAAVLRARGWTGTTITLSDFLQKEAVAAPAAGPAVRDDAEPFLLLFSSGTTSNPKAFLKTRHQYRANFAVSSAHLEPGPGVATLAPGPVSYSLTLYALIESLASGGSAHLADEFDPVQLGRRISEEKITRVVAVPAVVQALIDACRRGADRFSTLELVVTGGANLPAILRTGLADVLPCVRLISYYGAAEIGFIGDSRDGDGTRISVYAGVGASIRDEQGNEVPDGDPGTLWIRADACSHGYLPGTTDATLLGQDGWATVNDQGRMVDGALVLAGRVGDIAITGGHKVMLPDVERAFDGMPHLGAVCAVALPHERLGAVVALLIEGAAPARADLLTRAREKLAPQFVPRRWYRVDRLPRTVGGKIRRTAAADLVAHGEAERL
ncbi:long-chain fatty acid--CoA ligase [Cryobacterium sp. MLB-32]|uniref:class I adenylate-forming enzyme family protein n=1 Tax=Cryobacterium sp. MLB-32 TaxID=1529318 RepID=UPI0004E693F5|nr:class I adenylate-forming enzyme family protein [Cryobacterium sp. MLB-32]KFF60122.1 long-chain fatty acid--CoA ligase [Cryobacterium sp. MLB-32]